MAAIVELVTSNDALGLGGSGQATPVEQLQAVAEWLGRRLGQGDATAPKLKTLFLLEKREYTRGPH